jgi:hypothetical protein
MHFRQLLSCGARAWVGAVMPAEIGFAPEQIAELQGLE